ncbi:MAG TPA: hypothetical protein DCR28_04480, partial [Eubacterium sp.]|nr:hypothetical protein [Eubacterium sp.]
MGKEFEKDEKLNKEELENQVEVTEEMPEKEDYEQELARIIKSDAPDTVKLEQIDDYHENDIAAVLEDLGVEERKELYHLLGIERLSEIFAYLEDPGEFV